MLRISFVAATTWIAWVEIDHLKLHFAKYWSDHTFLSWLNLWLTIVASSSYNQPFL